MWDKLWVMTKQKSQNLLVKVDPLSTIRNNKFITQGEKFSGNRDSEGESFCIEYIVAAFKAAVWKIDMGFRIFFCNTRWWAACVQQKFESVSLHVTLKETSK